MKFIFHIKPLILCIVSMIFAMAMGGFLFYARGFYAGAGCIGFWVFVYYAIFGYQVYERNN